MLPAAGTQSGSNRVGSAGGTAKCPSQERRHLLARDDVDRAEPVVGGRIATPGDSGRRQAVDLAFEDRTGVVTEQVAGAGSGVAGAPDQESGQLFPRHLTLRAEPAVGGRAAARGGPGGARGE